MYCIHYIGKKWFLNPKDYILKKGLRQPTYRVILLMCTFFYEKKEMLLIFLSFINKTSLNLETEDKSQQKQQIQHFKADTIHPIHHKYYKADLTLFRAQHSFSPVGVCYNAYYSGQPLGFILPCTFLLS